jgi:hypothetical protein
MWYTPGIPAFWKLREEDCEFKANLGCRTRPCWKDRKEGRKEKDALQARTTEQVWPLRDDTICYKACTPRCVSQGALTLSPCVHLSWGHPSQEYEFATTARCDKPVVHKIIYK